MKLSTFKLKLVFAVTGIFALSVFFVNAQTSDSLHKTAKEFKNTIKLNVTSRILYDKAFMLGYERVINKHQSLNIFGGVQEFPLNGAFRLSNANVADVKKKSGYSFGADYRFYLSNENKYNAPRGIYLAPFVSFYQFSSDRTLTHTDTAGTIRSTNLNTRINFLNVGGELGYQFILWKRLVIDAVMFGPAVTNYKFKARLQADIPGLDENEALQEFIDALKEKLPLLDELTKEEGVNRSGTEAFWSVGF
ncbi:MAG TPA: hypothetical protein VFV68_16200, partial [Agriterribacter sp.]|nr:hypothetical protein [Agriterribacter sp.]